MKSKIAREWCSVAAVGWLGAGLDCTAADQFIVFNLGSGRDAEAIAQISKGFEGAAGGQVRIGVAAIFSYLHHPPAKVAADLREFLRLAGATDTPVVVQLDGEQWWGDRPDL